MKLLLNHPEIIEILKNDKLVVVDGGARGALFKPLNQVDKSILHVLRFEPDPDGVPEQTEGETVINKACLLYTSPSPRDATLSRMPSSA